jgi:hypothetical protein
MHLQAGIARFSLVPFREVAMRNILACVAVLGLLAVGFGIAAEIGSTDKIDEERARLARIRDVQTTFGKHIRSGVFWKTDEGVVKLWRPLDSEDRTLEFLDDATIFSITPHGFCDDRTLESCKQELEEACRNAGHCGVDRDSVTTTKHADYSETCAGDCTCQDGGVCGVGGCPQSFQICGPLT